MNWLEVSLELPVERIDHINHVFFAVGSGVSIESSAFAPSIAVLKGYLPDDEDAPAKLAAIRDAVVSILGAEARLRVNDLSGEDWLTSWRTSYKPFQVGKRLVVVPSWEAYTPGTGEVMITLDPGLAFGCGTHPTTATCMELLESHLQPGHRVFDVGTGSGILAVTSAKLGAGAVWAVDNDALAVRVARENIARNAVDDRVTVVQGHLLDPLPGRADLIVANIVAEAIAGMTPQVGLRLVKAGLFVAGGIHQTKRWMVAEACELAGLRVLEERRAGEWLAVAGVKE